MRRSKGGPRAWIFAMLWLVFPAQSARLQVAVVDSQGGAVADAVVYAVAPAGRSGSAPPKTASMDQVNKEFVPFVLPVQAGAEVRFPNKDNIRHHVYSFSPAKKFEIKLYSGVPGKPVVFDKPGVVALGCNIHDAMVGYIYVVDTPWFTKTSKDGSAVLEGIPAGSYEVRVWHPRLAGDPVARAIRIDDGNASPARFSMELAPAALSTRP